MIKNSLFNRQLNLSQPVFLRFFIPNSINVTFSGQSDCDIYILQTNTDEPAPEIYSDYKSRRGIETYNNYVNNNAGFNGLKFQNYYEQHDFDFIMLVTGMMHSALNDVVRKLGKSSISTFDIFVKAGHMRMVLEEGEWKLHNTRTKDIGLLGQMGFIPEQVLTL